MWSEQDKVGLRDYLGSTSGQNFIEMLQRGTPRLVGRTIEETALEAKEKQGWENCIATILANAQQTPEAKRSEFTDTSVGIPR